MNFKYIFSVFSCAFALGAYGQVISPRPAGWIDRAQWMENTDIFNAAIDQSAYAQSLSLDIPQKERTDFIEAVSAVHSQKGRAAELLKSFIEKYPASTLRMQAIMALGDCYYGANGQWQKALEYYEKVDPAYMPAAKKPLLEYRTAYCLMKTERWREADALMAAVAAESDDMRTAATFYRGYIAYAQQDYSRAKSFFKEVNYREYPGSMANYYLAQIDYLNGNYAEALASASTLLNSTAPEEFKTEAYRVAGESAFMLGDNAKARQYLDTYYARAEEPTPAAMYILGLFAYEDGRYTDAVNLMTPAIMAGDAMSQSAYLYIGQALLKEGDYDGAIMAFDKALNMDYDREIQETAFYNYAVTSLQGGKVPFGNAVGTFESFLRRYPDSKYAPDAQKYIVSAYFKSNDYESALRSINNMSRPSDETSAAKQRALYMLGAQALASGNARKAIDYLGQCGRLARYDSDVDRQAQLLLGEAYYKDGQYALAEKALQTYIKSARNNDPNLTLAYFDLGYSQLPLKKYKEAAANFRKVTNKPASFSTEIQADAYNRLGDACYYMSQFADAAQAYDTALELNPAAGDYSLMQKALMEGYQRHHKAKIDMLADMQRRYPTSSLIPAALLETTESYIQLGDNASAIEVYRKLIDGYPSTAQARQGSLQMALTMHNDGKRADAIAAYKQVVTRYPSSDEAAQATEALKRLYAADGHLSDLQAFLNSVPDAPKMEAGEADQLSFEAAEKEYITRQSSALLKQYTANYPDGASRAKALSYLMEGAEKEGNGDEAYAYACEIAENYPDNSLVIDALVVKARKEAADGRNADAMLTWQALEQKASTQYARSVALMGIARCANEAADNAEAIRATSALLSSSNVSSDDRTEALYIRGVAEAATGNRAEASALWEQASSNPANYYGIASSYLLAQSAFDSGNLADAERIAKEITDADTPHAYWVARAFILLSDIFSKQGDDFKAQQYLKSLQQNYPGTESDIFEMIEQRVK